MLLLSRLYKATKKTWFLRYSLKRAINLTRTGFGISFSFFDGKFSLKLGNLIFEFFVSVFQLFLFYLQLLHKFAIMLLLFLITLNLIFQILNLNLVFTKLMIYGSFLRVWNRLHFCNSFLVNLNYFLLIL